MTNQSITGNAVARFSLESDGNSEQIIALADSLSQQRWGMPMDSLDLGDSMGVFIRAATEDFYNGDLDSIFIGDGFFVRMNLEFDLFKWEGISE